ncbi:MAG TPA: SRPBCC family protein [Actinomycetota bacterium]|nr:SRPBCC family protein [Actinomycetota bacterium]
MTPGNEEPRLFEISLSKMARCPVNEVLKNLQDPITWPRWQPEIIASSGPAPLREGDAVEGRAALLGFVVDGRSTTVSSETDVFEEDVVVGVRMRVRYELREVPGGVVVTRRLTASLPRGFSGRILSFFLKRRLTSMQRGVLNELVAQSEA